MLVLWRKLGRNDKDDGGKTCDLGLLPKEELETSSFKDVPEEQEDDENLYSLTLEL